MSPASTGYVSRLQTGGGIIYFFHETSRTLVFGTGVYARAFFESLLRENMDLGRPENAELLFRRGQRLGRPSDPPPGGFQDQDRPVLRAGHDERLPQALRVKRYLKDGTALRIEGVISNPRTCGSTAGWRNSPGCRTRRVQSTRACWQLRLPAGTPCS